LLALPYLPQLNPQEHVWDEVREKEFSNRVYNRLNVVIPQLEPQRRWTLSPAQAIKKVSHLSRFSPPSHWGLLGWRVIGPASA
jgi:hypothetical protein